MSNFHLQPFERRALLDIASYGRQGPGRRTHITQSDVAIIGRTGGRDPEVVVKVLSQGAQNLKGVGKHLEYIGRDGEVPLLTDDGREVRGGPQVTELLNDWGLDIDELRGNARLTATDKRRPARLVHKLTFSMPPGTPPEKVFGAVQTLAREEFALSHRYAMALHTDEPHPHVHVVIKALSEQGVRLNIKKATLRMWRSEFARHLRERGVRANATERLVRGRVGRAAPDAVYRARQRGVLLRVDRRPADLAPMQKALAEVRAGWLAVQKMVKLANERPEPPISRHRDYELER